MIDIYALSFGDEVTAPDGITHRIDFFRDRKVDGQLVRSAVLDNGSLVVPLKEFERTWNKP